MLCGVERVLDVALADDAEVADGLDRDRAEQLVLLVVERLRRRHDDGLARVDAHRVEVLHVADGDAVVAPVAHDLVLDLLPAAQALLDQHLGHAAGEGAARAPASRSASRLDDAAALAAQREAPAQHHREADLAGRGPRLVGGAAGAAARGGYADLRQPLDEELAVLGVADGFDRRAEHPHAVLVQDARLVERQPAVERGLAAEGEQDARRTSSLPGSARRTPA